MFHDALKVSQKGISCRGHKISRTRTYNVPANVSGFFISNHQGEPLTVIHLMILSGFKFNGGRVWRGSLVSWLLFQ